MSRTPLNASPGLEYLLARRQYALRRGPQAQKPEFQKLNILNPKQPLTPNPKLDIPFEDLAVVRSHSSSCAWVS